jgi:hypothetical protein
MSYGRKKFKASAKSKAKKKVEARVRRVAYATYLASDLWGAIRSAVLSQRPQCELCGERATEVHHDSYHPKVMLGEMNDSLVSICRGCHTGIEFDGKQKLTSREVRRKLRTKLIETERGAVAERLKEAQRKLSNPVKPNPGPPVNRELEKRKRDAEIARQARLGDPKVNRPVSRWMATKVVNGKRGPLANRVKPTDS